MLNPGLYIDLEAWCFHLLKFWRWVGEKEPLDVGEVDGPGFGHFVSHLGAGDIPKCGRGEAVPAPSRCQSPLQILVGRRRLARRERVPG